MILRDATPSDWEQVWPFLRDIVAAGETYCWPRDTPEDAARAWWMTKPGGRVFVAEEDGRILGTGELHPNQPAGGSHVANAGFMIDPSASGRGVGRALASHVIESARSAGFGAMQFNAVVETNVAAVHLWQSMGFAILTTVPNAFLSPAHGYVGLHVMYRDLTELAESRLEL